jgi:hypothetical protein
MLLGSTIFVSKGMDKDDWNGILEFGMLSKLCFIVLGVGHLAAYVLID